MVVALIKNKVPLSNCLCHSCHTLYFRFIYVETSFLWQWYEEQDETTRQKIIDLINSGQLEIIGGGWSMNDEAVTLYQSIIDQFTLGLK